MLRAHRDLVIFAAECVSWTLIFSAALFLLGFCLQWISRAGSRFLIRIVGLKLFGLLFFPGVMLHELSHALAANCFLYQVKDIKWFDPWAEQGTHGHVKMVARPVSAWLFPLVVWQGMGRLFIGVAPLLVGPGLVLAFLYYGVPGGSSFLRHPSLSTIPHWTGVLGGLLYLMIATILNVELSAADLDQFWKGFFWLLFTVLVGALIWGTLHPSMMTGHPLRRWPVLF